MTTQAQATDRWISNALAQDSPRSKSLIVTLYGDALLPYTSGIWLTELIRILKPLKVNSQLARVSAFRLAEEGWLQSNREGRRSRYSVTPSGRERTQRASQRIYRPPAKLWRGRWTIVTFSRSSPIAHRAELRRELEWQGFGMLRTGMFVHPDPDLPAFNELLSRFHANQHVVLLQARSIAAGYSYANLVAECWNLDNVAQHYTRFVARFSPLLSLLSAPVAPQTAFVIQTLLIHAYRRLVLHDPRLPAALLPDKWPGHTAYDICRTVYLRTHAPAAAFLTDNVEETARKTTAPALRFFKR